MPPNLFARFRGRLLFAAGLTALASLAAACGSEVIVEGTGSSGSGAGGAISGPGQGQGGNPETTSGIGGDGVPTTDGVGAAPGGGPHGVGGDPTPTTTNGVGGGLAGTLAGACFAMPPAGCPSPEFASMVFGNCWGGYGIGEWLSGPSGQSQGYCCYEVVLDGTYC